MIAKLRKYPRLKSLLKKALHILKSFSASYRLKNKVNNVGAVILPTVNCIDVGAFYYPHPAWEIFRRSDNTHWLAVEPNVQNLFYLKSWQWPAKVKSIETGLSETGGEQILYVTNVDSGSSLCEPCIEPGMEHRVLQKDYFFPVKKVSIQTLTLESVINDLMNESPILVKLDTQGSEFSILRSVDKNIMATRFVCVELENTLLARPIMKGSTPFHEVFAFFEALGFELVYMKPIQINAPLANKTLAGASVLNECDAVFLLRMDIAKQRNLETQLTMVGCYIAYSLYGEAIEMLTHILDRSNCSELIRARCQNLLVLLQP